MRKNCFICACNSILIILALALMNSPVFSQQLKLGRNPYSIVKSALLELNADNQGLLYPRIADTALINVLLPPDGMVIYFVPTKQLMLRSNGRWNRLSMTSDNLDWATTGNTGLSAANFLGTIDDKPLVLKSFNNSYAELGRRQTLGLVQAYPDYTNVDEQVLHIRSAMQFYAPGALFYKPKFFVDTAGNMRIKGSSAGTDLFEIGGIGTVGTNGGCDFIVGDDGDEPFIFKSYNYQSGTTEIMRMQNGRMGIGNASPAEKLDVTGNIRFSGALMPGGQAGTTGYILQSNGAGAAPTWLNTSGVLNSTTWVQDGNSLGAIKNFGTLSNHALPFITNSVERMRLATNGYLGLGTASPAGRFHAVSDNSETGNDYIFDDYSNANNPGIFIRRSRGTPTTPLDLVAGDRLGSVTFVPRLSGALSYAPGSSLDAYYQGSGGSDNKTDLHFLTSGVERAVIDKNGNFGIGSSAFDTISPEKLLVDAGSSTYTALLAKGNINNYFQINIKNASTGTQSSSDLVATANNGTETTNFIDVGINGSGYVYLTGNPIETGKANDGYLLSSGNDLYIVNNNPAKDMIFLTGGTALTNEAMRITASETVGIATSTPNASTKLDVNGAVKIGTAGSVVKNMITATATFSTNTTINAATLTTIPVVLTPAHTDVTYTLPAANTLSSTQATVMVSPSADLPTGVVIAFARATSTTTLKIRFMNNSNSSQTIASGTKLYLTITEF